MRKIVHLPTPRRHPGSEPTKPVAMQNVMAVRTRPDASIATARCANAELLDRIGAWSNERGEGEDTQ
jgi:hypothetical protein